MRVCVCVHICAGVYVCAGGGGGVDGGFNHVLAGRRLAVAGTTELVLVLPPSAWGRWHVHGFVQARVVVRAA